MTRPIFATTALLLLTVLAGCGGGDSGTAPSVVVSLSPARDTLTVGTSTQFSALVTGAGDDSVTWSIVEGFAGGILSPAGLYTAGATAGTFRIVATSIASPTSGDTAVVLVVKPPVIRLFRAVGTKAPAGGRGLLVFKWDADPGVVPSVLPGGGAAISDSFFTPTLSSAGPQLFTGSVRSLADSVVTDTATIMAVAPAAGSFQATGSLGTARINGAVTELKDGRVLVAGGWSGQPSVGLTAAELYDPTTGQFTATGSLGQRRIAPLAATLNDGRVLVVGFDSLNGPSTELYDTATGHFTPGPNAPDSGAMGVALLGDGRVFVLTSSSTAELFDPVADSFAVAGAMNIPRQLPGVVPLLDGRILVAGGVGAMPPANKTAEIFDPATGLFTLTGSMAEARVLGTYTRLADGRVLAAGGIDVWTLQFAQGGEVYDPNSGTWSPVGQLALQRYDHSAALLNDGRVLLVAGDAGFYVATPYAETFDPATGQFTPLLGTLGGSRTLPMTLRLSDGRVLLMGGTTVFPQPTSLVEIFQ